MKTLARVITPIGLILAFSTAGAATIDYADAVVNFTPGPGPGPAFLEPANSLGAPDVNTTNGQACFVSPSTVNCKFTSLGNGGSLTLQFTNNVLTGSGNSDSDLFVVEVGVAEASTVAISKNGSDWFDVGSIAGGGGSSIGVFTYGFDIDSLGAGFGPADSFTFVRVTDVLNDANTSPEGADIDAIGAIQTVVPLPAGAWLWPVGLVLMRWMRRRPG